MNLLLMSNSTNHGGTYLGHVREVLADYLEGVRELVFVPYALHDWDGYTRQAAQAFGQIGIGVRGAHTVGRNGLESAPAIFVGGGNTFRLVRELQRRAELAAIRVAVGNGARYLGASAGSNIASPSLRTTNDMPIVRPDDFSTLGFIPFQINPHYLDPDPGSIHNGETRAERIRQFLEENDVAVLGLREGTFLRVDTGGERATATIGGSPVQPAAPGPAVLFRRGVGMEEVSGDVSDLLASVPEFDLPR